MNLARWEVHKFGGSSLDGSSGFLNASQQLFASDSESQKAVVVSAMSGTTQEFLYILDLALARDHSYIDILHNLKGRHLKAGRALLSDEAYAVFEKRIKQDTRDAEQVLRASWLLRRASQETSDWLVGFGELWSAQLMCATLSISRPQGKVRWLDTREILFVQHNEHTTEVNWKHSQKAFSEWLQLEPDAWIVITGFIASTEEGAPTTLKRDGSDFTASIMGALLQAESLTIWTDVNGVYSADPRRVPEAQHITHMSWQEATELAYFGANVIHPLAMAPAITQNIPITIRNSFEPDAQGTHIAHTSELKNGPSTLPVKGFSTIDNMALINVEGSGMIGVPGISQRLFGALREVGVSVVMISQASSEHSICFAVSCTQAQKACDAVQEAFYKEFEQGLISSIQPIQPCSILAAVGDSMVDTPGVAAQFFDALGKAGINVRAIAQGSSERNISAVIDQKDSTRALRAVHGGFFLSRQTLSVGLIGPGLIGRAFLEQVHTQLEHLRTHFHIDLRVRGIMNSSTMLLSESSIPLHSWEHAFEQTSRKANMDAFVEHIQTEYLPHSVIIDCSASTEAVQWYPQWLERGIHVVTPNKKAFSDSQATYKTIRTLRCKTHTHAFYEATVGAGLPVLSTLRDLIQTGDTVLQIEGIFSGTLAYIFNTFSSDLPFSKVVKQAKAQGYTEPDPRDDLSGMDVARKLVILARELGLEVEIDQIPVQNLVSEELQQLSDIEECMKHLPDMDAYFSELLTSAQEEGHVLRYVGHIDCQTEPPTLQVALKSYPRAHAFAGIQGSDNIIAFRTQRYDAQPLIVRGPGAGPAVTASGVFADLLRLAAHLGAPS